MASTATVDDPTRKLSDLPPSAKLVAVVLDHEGPLSQTELIEETLLPQRTAREALDRLEERGLLERRVSYTDARKRLYSLAAEW